MMGIHMMGIHRFVNELGNEIEIVTERTVGNLIHYTIKGPDSETECWLTPGEAEILAHMIHILLI